MEEEKKKAAELRAEYERQREENKNVDLGQFKIQPGETVETGDDPKVAADALKFKEMLKAKLLPHQKFLMDEIERWTNG